MNTRLLPALLLSLVLSLSLLTGCGSKKEPETVSSGAKTESPASGQISDELAHHAYDMVFVLSFATIEAETGENNVSLSLPDDSTALYTFDKTVYLPEDAPEATASGTMKAVNGETTDRSEVNMSFTGDPKGLKTVTIESTGPHGERHTEGTILINGMERPFMEFVEYFTAKAGGFTAE